MDMTFELFNEDNLAVLRRMPDNSVAAVVTDPPYGLGKEPDALAMLRDWLDSGHHEVKGKGFMGKTWDSFVPQPAQWKEVYRVLKPGGHVLCFAGTRTQDLMALGLRIAGFEIRDLVAWVYGSGFPKSADISKHIDKQAGAERERGKARGGIGTNKSRVAQGYRPNEVAQSYDSGPPVTAAAAEWEGWGTALKPALEPITLARKPLSENTVAANVLEHGTGAINVDGCRVPTDDKLGGGAEKAETVCDNNHEGWDRPWKHDDDAREAHAARVRENVARAESLGRFPANLIHNGSDEVLAGFPNTKSGNIASHHLRNTVGGNGNTLGKMKGVLGASFGDEGSAARFFYCAKASKRDRDEGLEGFEAQASRNYRTGNVHSQHGGRVPDKVARNNHPTVKPTDLMRYLCRLITPPGGTVLDPWMGSGSTGKACAAEGFSFIGIDSDTEHGYFLIAEARVSAAFGEYQPGEWI